MTKSNRFSPEVRERAVRLVQEHRGEYPSLWAAAMRPNVLFARRIVGWRVSSAMRTDFVLDALEQALFDRQPERADALIHHSDRGSQYVSIRYTERLAEAGLEPSVGSRGDFKLLFARRHVLRISIVLTGGLLGDTKERRAWCGIICA